LAGRATGDLLFFTDADTMHQPGALRAFVVALEGEDADLMGGFPRQEVLTLGEQLIVPFFLWVIYCFTPLWLGYRLRRSPISTAVGQALMFRRATYEAIGGHGAVRDNITEDIELARRIKVRGYRWRMMHITDLVSCRMYRSGREASAALSRNLFAAFGFRALPFLFAWGWLLVMFLKPYLDLSLYALGQPIGVPLAAVLVCIGLALVVWLFPYYQLGLPLAPVLVYPLTVLIMVGIAVRSLWFALSGRLTWKDRVIDRPRLRLF
jgi:chlorobactene glucosyltransferase